MKTAADLQAALIDELKAAKFSNYHDAVTAINSPFGGIRSKYSDRLEALPGRAAMGEREHGDIAYNINLLCNQAIAQQTPADSSLPRDSLKDKLR